MIENSPAGLVMLESEVMVTVTGEEHHQAALARFPVAQGMQRHVVVELAWCTIASGKYRGQRAIEVRLDGQRIGELTHLMSQRYAPLVAQLTARGARPGCQALIQWGNRGLEVLLRLPRNGNVVIPLPAAPVAVVPPPMPRRTSSQAPKWIAAAVIALIFVAALASTDEDSPSTTPAAQLATSTYEATSASPSSTTTTTVAPTTTTTTVAPAPPVAQPPAAQNPVPKVNTPAPPPPAAQPQPQPQPQPQCDPNYSGCVPIASDVDCAGGSGNGPAYVSGPIRVTGIDIYGLDNDKDGIACE